MFAPIAIFCYRRSIEELLKYLEKNKEFIDSPLYIFCDGSKSVHDYADVTAVRGEVEKIESKTNVFVEFSDKNKGLARSIVDGVEFVLKKHEKIIVLEDDLIVSESFLKFMNDSLDFYKNNKKIWSISGYTPPMKLLENYNKFVFLSPRASSWGWATWLDRWEMVDWEASRFTELKNSPSMINDFNIGGDDMFLMLELQMLGKIDSWAIRWCFSQFLNNAYAVVPKTSLISNRGFRDGVGSHNTGNDKKWRTKVGNTLVAPEIVEVDDSIIEDWRRYHNLRFHTKIGYFLKKNGGYSFAKKIFNIFD